MPTLDPRVDAYIAKSAAFAQPLLIAVRAAAHEACPDVVEAIKWGMPFFTYRGKNLAHVAAFKQHLGLGLWYGAATNAEREAGNAMGNFGRITSMAEMPTQRELQRLLRSGMAAIEQGVPGPTAGRARRRPPPEVPADLAAALNRAPEARRFYDSLAPSHQREYVTWIAGAKRDETRQRRLATTLQQLAEGKRWGWKNERPSKSG
jgi:uncharacterized protein YdeI (YjbR/CyaY-like superfamily)